MRRITLLLSCLIILTILMTGCGLFEKLGLSKEDDEAKPVSSIVMGEEDAGKLAGMVSVHLYFKDGDKKLLRREIRYIPLEEAKKSTENLASIIISELIEGPDKSTGLSNTIPTGTKLVKPVKIE
ncbi:MAG: GerMN domain-containing protein, partial [Clostridiales bacterium]|nr:GerMN domain-containing protein [Clostridiales bacterium]